MKFIRTHFSKILVYLSIIFLIIFLYKFDYLKFNNLTFNYLYLSVSLVFLWAGYVFSSISWWNILRLHQIKIPMFYAISSHGIAIFAKYIPGKIWVILGRASKVAHLNYSLKTTSYISLKEQLIYLWLGLIISTPYILIYYSQNTFTFLIIALIIGLSIFLFIPSIRNFSLNLMLKIFKKKLDIPEIDFKENIIVMFFCLVYWFLWLTGFYFFTKSIIPDTGFSVGFVFPVSVSVGLIAIIMPGGLGVREGIMVAFLNLMGISLEIATTISIAARLWFITGEFFIFFLSILLNRVNKNYIHNTGNVDNT